MTAFTEFYSARRPFLPFPWMVRLAERFAAGSVPDVIDLPTGSGKSDIVVIWAWARTQRADLPRRRDSQRATQPQLTRRCTGEP